MLTSLILFLAITSVSPDPVNAAIESYIVVESYQVTLRSRSGDSSEVIRYYYKKPGFVRMEFIKPHKGAVLVYNPSRNEVRLKPFGILNSLVLTLSPDNRLVKSPKGHRVDKSDIGELLKTVRRLQNNGKTEILTDEDVGGRPATLIKVEGNGEFSVDHIHRYHLWLEKKTSMPIKASSYDVSGELIEEVLMYDLEINPRFEGDFFDL